jgi:mRNA interferase MazF
MSNYVPNKGDIVWIDFDPHLGREQAKRRPAIIISPYQYNLKTSLCLLCPITSKIKKYPFEVVININGMDSVILSDQVKSFDWKIRNAAFITNNKNILNNVIKNINLLLDN